MAMVVLDAGMTNVALPTIARSFSIDSGRSVLVASSYQLALLIGLLPAAHAAERLDARSLFVGGIIVFTLASAMAACAPSFPFLVTARFIQGVGGSAILALGIALLRCALGSERLASAIAWNALNVALCAAAGPTVGAVVLTVGDWRWLYLLNVPVGLLAATASVALPKILRSGASIDWRSIFLHAAAAASLFVAFDTLLARPALALLSGGTAAGCTALLIRRERSKASPLIPLDLLQLPSFRLAVGASLSCFVAQSAGLLALPFYLHDVRKGDMLTTGLILASWPLAVALSSPWANRLAGRFKTSAVCAGGAAIFAIGLFAASVVPAGASVAPLGLCVVICGVGFGLFQIPNNRNLFLGAPVRRSAAAGGVQGTARLAGQTMGAIVVTLLFAAAPGVTGSRLALAIAGWCAVVSALISVRRGASIDRSSGPREVC